MSWVLYALVGFLLYQWYVGSKKKGPKPEPKKKIPAKKASAKPIKAARPEKVLREPHEILGVDPEASPAEIRRAYQRMMQEYHPDRVANAASELQQLAERRSKEINAAYESMMRSAD
jgi:DnaJ-domain-containing protein 1